VDRCNKPHGYWLPIQYTIQFRLFDQHSVGHSIAGPLLVGAANPQSVQDSVGVGIDVHGRPVPLVPLRVYRYRGDRSLKQRAGFSLKKIDKVGG
jgi:hypothetical protein